jgi:alpha-methylacyl-CoA racemase
MTNAPQTSGPLSGLRVVELAGIGPAPFAARTLAQLGADVVQIDRPRQPGRSARLSTLRDNRPTVRLDLKDPRARDELVAVLGSVDVLIEGFRPGVMERLGLGPDVCLRHNPRLIYARMTGWGQDGPLAHAAGHDINYAGLTGALHAIGPADQPVPPLNLVADFGGGALYLIIGILASLHERATSGKGQIVDAAMVDGAAALMTMTYGMLAAGTWIDGRASNLLDGGAPFYRTYRCADGRFVAVGAIEPPFYAALLAGLGLASPTPAQQHDRSRWPEHQRAFAAAFATRTRDDWVEHFAETDACVSPVLSLDEAPRHPHLVERGTFVDPGSGPLPGPAPRFSRTPAKPVTPPPAGEISLSALAERWMIG